MLIADKGMTRILIGITRIGGIRRLRRLRRFGQVATTGQGPVDAVDKRAGDEHSLVSSGRVLAACPLAHGPAPYRAPARPSSAVPRQHDALMLQAAASEVEQQTALVTGCLQVIQDLRMVNRRQRVCGLDLDQDVAIADEVDSVVQLAGGRLCR
jgi:hypothetical protein